MVHVNPALGKMAFFAPALGLYKISPLHMSCSTPHLCKLISPANWHMANPTMATPASKPHIVIVPFPAQGHITPTLHLARKLAMAEFRVTLVTVDSIIKQLLQLWRPPEELDVRLEPLRFSYHIPHGMDGASLQIKTEIFVAFNMLADPFTSLLQRLALETPKICAVIADYFVPPWCLRAAQSVGASRIVYFPGSAAYCSVHFYCPVLTSRGDVPVQDSELAEECQKRISDIPGLPPLYPADLPYYFRQNEGLTSDDVNFLRGTEVFDLADWILVNSFDELEPKTFEAMKSYFNQKFIAGGPLFSTGKGAVNLSLRRHENKCLEWLDAQGQDSVLYISTGSIAMFSGEQFAEIAEALKQMKQYFLWVVRPEQKVLLQQEGFAEMYEKFVAESKALGLVVSWAPQIEVLGHKSIGGFFTHAGWNSILESICNGIPLLTFSYLGDQVLNTRLVVDDWKIGFRVGLRHRMGLVAHHEVARAISLLMHSVEGKDARTRVRLLQDSARLATSEGGSSTINLRRLVSHLIS